MKFTSIINCEIIQDLLPNYLDNVSSSSTNQLVEEHLGKCEQCSLALKNMNEIIETDKIKNQDTQIDYLKGYRRNKIRTVIFTIVIVIIMLLIILQMIIKFCLEATFFVNVDQIGVYCVYEDQSKLVFCLNEEKYILELEQYEENEDDGKKIIYIKAVGKIKLDQGEGNGTVNMFCETTIDEDTKKICIKDKRGNIKEIWNKQEGFLIYK